MRRSLADEVYWFDWVSSCDAGVRIRVAWLGDEVMFFRTYRGRQFSKSRRSHGRLSRSDWMLVEDAVIAAGLWMLDEHGGQRGLDGATWLIAGRRRHDFHFITRWSPRWRLWDLGRLFFDLAGLEEVRL